METASSSHPDTAAGFAVTEGAAAVALPRQRHAAAMLPGLGICGAIALVSLELSRLPLLGAYGVSALTLAVLIGMLLGNTALPATAAVCASGIDFAKQTLLRAGIVLFGFRLTFADIAQIGTAGLLVDAAMIATTFVLAVLIGTRVLKLERSSAILIGAGAAVCGAAAVLAAAAVIKARSTQVTVAVATVVLFGTIAMFLVPLIHPLAVQALGPRAGAFGIYIGSTIHEVAQAIAAGSMFDPTTANMSLVAKLGRVAMLGPFLLLLSAWHARGVPAADRAGGTGMVIPWFALGFLAAAAFSSVVGLPQAAMRALDYAATVLLAMAMAALGLGAQLPLMRSAGFKPIALALVLALWLLGGGLAINIFASRWH